MIDGQTTPLISHSFLPIMQTPNSVANTVHVTVGNTDNKDTLQKQHLPGSS